MFSHNLAGPVLIQYTPCRSQTVLTVDYAIEISLDAPDVARVAFMACIATNECLLVLSFQLKKATVSSGALEKCDGFFSGCSAFMVGRSEADTVGEQASPYPLHRAVVLPSMRGDSGDSAGSSLGNHNAPVPHGCLLGGNFCKFA